MLSCFNYLKSFRRRVRIRLLSANALIPRFRISTPDCGIQRDSGFHRLDRSIKYRKGHEIQGRLKSDNKAKSVFYQKFPGFRHCLAKILTLAKILMMQSLTPVPLIKGDTREKGRMALFKNA
ncbi:hypothetical protein [Succinimonas sp.]|uniref:hypothetical protein n=1 Tax=Succinimonas sp. TaxID=1936151 RepID=UPI00386F35B3